MRWKHGVAGVVGGVVLGVMGLLFVGEESLVLCSTASVIIGLAFVKQTDWREGGLWGFIIAFMIGFIASVDAGTPAAIWQATLLAGLTGAAAGLLSGAIFFLCYRQTSLTIWVNDPETGQGIFQNKQDVIA